MAGTPGRPPAIGAAALLAALGRAAVLLDPERRVLAADPATEAAAGPAAGVPCHRYLRGSAEPCPACPARDALATGRAVRGTEPLPGRAAPVAVEARPVIQDGRTAGVLLTEVRGAAVSRDEAACEALFEEAPCFISVQDRALRVLRANRLARETFGAPEERPGLRCWEWYKRRTEPCLDCPVAATLADGLPHTSEETVVTASGEPRRVLVTVAPLPGPGELPERVIEMSTDITELRQAQGRLEELGMLVGRIAHDVKGVLTGLDGGIYLVSTGLERGDDGRVQEGWAMVRRNVDRIRTLVLDILYHAKDREPHRRLLSPARLVEEAVRRFRHRAEEAGVSLRLEVDPGAVALEADPRALESLLANLLENALDAVADAGGEVVVTVRSEEDGVAFAVRDTGPGMDEATAAAATTPFFSGKGSAGTGLGLYIAHRIAEAHGGSLEIVTAPGAGTTVTARIPNRTPRRGGRGASG